jgi:uncharacterized protein
MTTDPFREDVAVSWQVDHIAVNASLTRPEGKGPFPAVIMVAGSGPTDRNWNSPLLPGVNGSAALLASKLATSGYLTLRYDKLASGPQGKENAMQLAGKISMQSHFEELAGGMRLLAERDDVDTHHIFALTNSEGCIHALNYQIQASAPPFAGLMLTAPPARAVGLVAHQQIEAQLAPIPGGVKWLAAYDKAMTDFTAGRPVKIDETLPEGIRNLILSLTNPVNQPFARELWVTEPAVMLSKINVPVLIVIGKQDIQVDWQTEGSIFEALAKTHPNITIQYPENANHVLKYEPREKGDASATELSTAYNAEDRHLDEESLEIITTWLAAHRT